ncbi:MAG: ohpC [Acidimicrobiales bacterium]|nr:ohpC [Acidimicrobiales bacterium]
MSRLQYPASYAGQLTRVLEVGEGDDVVVCLHGAGSRADRWAPALELLAAEGFHAYALDFPGHGLAAKPAGYPYGARAFTEVVTAFVDALAPPRVALLGTSLGGHVAAWVACERPDRVRATVLIGAVGLVPWDREAAGAGSPIVDGSPAGVRAKLELLVEDDTLVTDAWVHEESQVNSSPGAADALAALGRALTADAPGDLVGERYAALGCPTLLVWGAQDRWVPPSVGEATARLLPDAPFALLDGTGHAPYFERPSDFTKLAAEFLHDPATLAAGSWTV